MLSCVCVGLAKTIYTRCTYGNVGLGITKYTVYIYVGLARTIYIRCIYGIYGREITKYTVIYGVFIRFWPTLYMYGSGQPYVCACFVAH